VDKEDGVLVIRRVHVRYRLRLDSDHAETARRVHEMHRPFCPIYRTLSGCIDITTELVTEGP
jgi:uncharacterized OsmC-like protein